MAGLVRDFTEGEHTRFTATARLIKGEHLGRIPRGWHGCDGHHPRGDRQAEAAQADPGAFGAGDRFRCCSRSSRLFSLNPISIAQYLPPGSMEFEPSCVDEASQVRPEDALGAIGSCPANRRRWRHQAIAADILFSIAWSLMEVRKRKNDQDETYRSGP